MADDAAGAPPAPTGEEDLELAKIVPRAEFIEDVEEFMKGKDSEQVLREMQARHQQYKYVEQEVAARRRGLLAKEPEIARCLDAVTMLQDRAAAAASAGGAGAATVLDFSLAAQVYARARLRGAPAAVRLWLGAGVMLEYPLAEAAALLAANLARCRAALAAAGAEAEYLRDQLTTTEVGMARVYNRDVAARRAAAAAAPAAAGKGAAPAAALAG